MKRIGAAVAAWAQRVRGSRDRLAELERRVAELEREPFVYVGTFEAGRVYTHGMFVTDRGSLWHCGAETTTSRPGTDGTWTLAVKRGRNARDAR